MPFRRIPRALLYHAAALAYGLAGAGAWAQTLGSESNDRINPLPTIDTPQLTSTTAPSALTTVPQANSANPTPANSSIIGSPSPAVSTTVDPASATPENNTTPTTGKVKPRKPKLYRPNPRSSPPLSALAPYRTAPGLAKTTSNASIAAFSAVDPVPPAPTVAAIPTPVPLRRSTPDVDPFAPTGVAVGSLRLFPFVETSAGYETNPNQTSTGSKASPVLRAEGGFDLRSDFSTNSLTASLRGGYSNFPNNAVANRPDLNGNVDGRIDVTRDDRIDIEGRLSLATQTPGSPLLATPGNNAVSTRATVVTEGATLGGTHTFNRLALNLRGSFDRTSYGDATQSDGTKIQYSRDSYNDYGVIGRASYEMTPAVIPFVEIGADSRVRDNQLDLSGYARSSTGVLARGGSTFEFSRLLTGTAALGYADRRYVDPRLPHLRGPTVDAALVYTYSPITKATLTAVTSLAETTLPAASGAIARSLSLEVAHVFFRDFTVSGIGTIQVNQYQGAAVQETFTQGTLKAAYAVSRDIVLTASATRQILSSSIQGSSFTDNIFLLGVRLQR